MTFLRRQIRERDIRELLLLGELIDAPRAMAMGLINRIVPAANLFHLTVGNPGLASRAWVQQAQTWAAAW